MVNDQAGAVRPDSELRSADRAGQPASRYPSEASTARARSGLHSSAAPNPASSVTRGHRVAKAAVPIV